MLTATSLISAALETPRIATFSTVDAVTCATPPQRPAKKSGKTKKSKKKTAPADTVHTLLYI